MISQTVYTFDYTTYSFMTHLTNYWPITAATGLKDIVGGADIYDCTGETLSPTKISISSTGNCKIPDRVYFTTSITVTAWVNPSSLPAADTYILRIGTTSGNEWDFQLSSSGYAGCPLLNSFKNGDLNYQMTLAPLTANTWQHVAFVFDEPTGALGLYVNGVYAGGGGTDSNYYVLGAVSVTNYFGSNVDAALKEIKVYNTALSPAMITQDMGCTSCYIQQTQSPSTAATAAAATTAAG
jgi:hypothetical protein